MDAGGTVMAITDWERAGTDGAAALEARPLGIVTTCSRKVVLATRSVDVSPLAT
jgi:hypothetical protein